MSIINAFDNATEQIINPANIAPPSDYIEILTATRLVEI
jgi:hypothetical protein